MEHHNLMDSRFFSFFTRLADLILLNFIFLLTCLPIVTIGASFAALYQVGAAMADGRESYILQSGRKTLSREPWYGRSARPCFSCAV